MIELTIYNDSPGTANPVAVLVMDGDKEISREEIWPGDQPTPAHTKLLTGQHVVIREMRAESETGG